MASQNRAFSIRKYLVPTLVALVLLGVASVVYVNENSKIAQVVAVDTYPTVAPATSTATSAVDVKAISIVAFGDSITAGYGITVPEAYPQRLEDLLRARGFAVEVINSGVSGETTAGGLRRAQYVANQNPNMVIVALGGNDVLRGIPPSNTKENLKQIITIFQKEGIQVVLAGMLAPANLGDAYVAEFNALYTDLARTYGVPLVPFLLEGVALDPAFNQADGIHPNQAGAQVIAEENILPVVLPLLEDSQKGSN